MKSFSELAQSVSFTRKGKRIVLNDKDQQLIYVGKGRSAYVFKIAGTQKVIKVFFPPFEYIAREEGEIYQLLQGNSFYPKFYEAGHNYLVIDYITGNTMFNCLVKGIQIKEGLIDQVDKALLYARDKGLNPSDIHLRNIIITEEGTIKLIDVGRFRQTKYCSQWEDLKKAYNLFYRRKTFPKKIPALLLNLTAFLYKRKCIPSLMPAKSTSSSYFPRL